MKSYEHRMLITRYLGCYSINSTALGMFKLAYFFINSPPDKMCCTLDEVCTLPDEI